jgi:N-acyl homoserine lactone hydrolase
VRGVRSGCTLRSPKATLLIGKGHWDGLTSPKPAPGVNPEPFANWIKGEGKVEPLPLDKDVFGDGTVLMLNTPGHHSLMVEKWAKIIKANGISLE